MKKRRVMLDGVIAGTELSGELDVLATEVGKVRRVLLDAGALEKDGGLAVTVQGKTDMVVALRSHYHQKDRFYLNLTGNPLSFLQGSNTYGYVEADRVIVTAFRCALESLGSMPKRIMKAVADRQINLHSLEFATYTNKVLDKEKLLNDWQYVYNTAYSKTSDKHDLLLDLLDLKVYKKHKDHTSLCLRLMSKDGSEEEAMMLVYDKARQLRDTATKSQAVALVPSDVENRLRLDLHLNYGWFRRRQVQGRKLKTLADLVDYVNVKGGWASFVAHEFQWALDRSLLCYMWSFDYQKVRAGEYPKHKNKRVDSRVYWALLKARTLMALTDTEWAEVFTTGRLKKKKINFDPHPELLELDMSII